MKVLMLGPARTVKGGMSSVVNNYFEYGLDKKIDLRYIETINDKNKLLKAFKEIKGKIEFLFNVKKYDIIHIHMASRRSTFRKGKYVRIAKKYNKKVIVHIHGAEYKIFFNECNEKQKKFVIDTLKLADKVIVLSEEWKEYFSQLVNPDKIIVIYNAILIPDDFQKNLKVQKLIFLGRFGNRKGIYDLLEIFPRLITNYPNIELYAAGDGEIEKVEQIVKTNNIEKNVHLLGWIQGNEKEKVLKEGSFFVLPSYNEGMPMSLIEGMAYKNICISTNVGGIPKVINNNVNGIIIEPGDREALYQSLELLLRDSELRKKLSNNARKTVEEKFNIEKNIKILIKLYQDLYDI